MGNMQSNDGSSSDNVLNNIDQDQMEKFNQALQMIFTAVKETSNTDGNTDVGLQQQNITDTKKEVNIIMETVKTGDTDPVGLSKPVSDFNKDLNEVNDKLKEGPDSAIRDLNGIFGKTDELLESPEISSQINENGKKIISNLMNKMKEELLKPNNHGTNFIQTLLNSAQCASQKLVQEADEQNIDLNDVLNKDPSNLQPQKDVIETEKSNDDSNEELSNEKSNTGDEIDKPLNIYI